MRQNSFFDAEATSGEQDSARLILYALGRRQLLSGLTAGIGK